MVANTDSVRKAIEASTGEDKVKTKPFEPQAKIPLPARPTHVAFTASDDALILATENGSQISVFQTTDLVTGNAQPAITIPTNGISLRAVVPNPDPNSAFVAMVTVNGELLMADLKAGSLVNGPNGPILKNSVSCVAWSTKGKQITAGLADGTAALMTPDGTPKDEIPRPSDLEGECHGESSSTVSLLGDSVNNYSFICRVARERSFLHGLHSQRRRRGHVFLLHYYKTEAGAISDAEVAGSLLHNGIPNEKRSSVSIRCTAARL